ncbi:hypothetical protein pah_c022o121 [Parachlamydia acanthamoebae str. Hall's coccus]|nr:hypothetical protein pah_c022o121 [Parachlamydia acanthamoebae str. Hall's coccus]
MNNLFFAYYLHDIKIKILDKNKDLGTTKYFLRGKLFD